MAEAQAIMGDNYFGPEAVKKMVRGLIPDDSILPIPFSKQELVRAKELDQLLILRIDGWYDDLIWCPLTMENLYLQLKLGQNHLGLYQDLGSIISPYDLMSCRNESFFISDVIKNGWALVSRRPITDSLGKNYLKQTDEIAMYTRNILFGQRSLPDIYVNAYKEWFSQCIQIKELMVKDSEAAAKKLCELQLNQLCRHAPVEIFYDACLVYLVMGQWLLSSYYTWTNRLFSFGKIVLVGYFHIDGCFDFHRSRPDGPGNAIGVLFSRTQ